MKKHICINLKRRLDYVPTNDIMATDMANPDIYYLSYFQICHQKAQGLGPFFKT